MQYDFAVGAGQSQTLDVSGRFFKYRSGTGVISVRTSGGGSVDLLPGQGIWNVEFSSLTVKDKSGLANAGVIVAGAFDYRDDRIAGSVEVIDGGRARTMANLAYMATGSRGAAPGLLGHFQFWNPAGSGRNVLIEQIIVGSALTDKIAMGFKNATLLTPVGNIPISKRSSGGVASVIVCYAEDNAASQYPVSLASLSPNTILPLKEPMCIEPGFGLIFRGTQLNQDFSVSLEFFEEAR